MVCCSWKRSTLVASTGVCGITEPGTAPIDSRNSKISATRIEVSCRQNQRSQPSGPSEGTFSRSSLGAVDSWAVAACSRASPSASGPLVFPASVPGVFPASVPVPVVLMDQIPTVKSDDQTVISYTIRSQMPVTSRTPTATSIPPPIRMTHT